MGFEAPKQLCFGVTASSNPALTRRIAFANTSPKRERVNLRHRSTTFLV